jgi:hypothetical protein
MADEQDDTNEFFKKLRQLAGKVAAEGNQDVFLYSGDISAPHDDSVFEACAARGSKRARALLILSTYGGDPHAAYRIARCFQDHYQRFSVLVAGFCKSSGTLLLLGANELVLMEQAELGPLDVQLRKSDEFGELGSGLTPMQALTVLQTRALNAFRDTFLQLRLQLELPTKTAADLASTFATNLYQPILAQVDPMRLGEMDRATRIAVEYGNRLDKRVSNTKDGGIARLVAGYPAHEFVIDRSEAADIFKNIRQPTQSERELINHIKNLTRRPLDTPAEAITMYLDGDSDEEPKAATGDSPGNPPPGGSPAGGHDSTNVSALPTNGQPAE